MTASASWLQHCLDPTTRRPQRIAGLRALQPRSIKPCDARPVYLWNTLPLLQSRSTTVREWALHAQVRSAMLKLAASGNARLHILVCVTTASVSTTASHSDEEPTSLPRRAVLDTYPPQTMLRCVACITWQPGSGRLAKCAASAARCAARP